MRNFWGVWTAMALVMSVLGSGVSYGQESSRTFPETGRTVRGRFLEYWQANGGLAQQGYPISDEMQERSDTDGKTYTVQYFERAVFELHPQNQKPYDVLLSLLGAFAYKQKYPNGEAGGRPAVPPQSNRRECAPTQSHTGPVYGGDQSEASSDPARHVLKGVVRSSRDCSPIAGARIEFMMPGPNDEHGPYQPPISTDGSGAYRFESALNSHIHIRVAADGYNALEIDTHISGGRGEGSFDIVLAPSAQPVCRTFQETGKTICDKFLVYWTLNGGLAQQGYPISEAFEEKSDLDGKTYTVQYFERAVFELHPQNQPPYDVLLSQLGTLRYRAKYGDATSNVGKVEVANNMLVPRSVHSAVLLPDGKVLIAGGMKREGDILASTELYDAATGRFVSGGEMAAGRVGHAAVLMKNGKVLMVGGFGGRDPVASAEVYDPVSGRFTPTGSMSERRGGMTATLLEDGRVLVAGGYDNVWKASAELYDPATGRFTPAGSMTSPRTAHSATLLRDGKVLLAGGAAGPSNVVTSAEVYDPRTGKFAAVGGLSAPRYKHAAMLLGDGNVLLIGGSDSRDWRGRYSSAELYNAANGRFSPTASMSEERFKLMDATALLPDGRLVVAGGGTRVEVYDPKTGKFNVAQGEMDAARYNQTATLLRDGRVLIAGGYDGNIASTAGAWIYSP